MTDTAYAELIALLPDLKRDEPLSRHCTIRTGGPAAAFLIVKDKATLIKAVTEARRLQLAVHLLGGGSNTLFSDRGFDGLVIKNMANHLTIGDQVGAVDEIGENEDDRSGEMRHEAADPTKYVSFLDLNYEERPGDTLVTAESGTNLTAMIVKTIDAGLTGLQWFGGIPGVIGAAVYNNIHGGTHFIGERLVEVQVLTAEGSIVAYPKSELALDYDRSRFHGSHDVILSTTFLLTKASAAEEEQASATFREWVRRKSQMQPKLGSMGSTFQNISQAIREQIGAPTTSTGWLIDQCGLKGHMIGKAQISPEHGNFIVNTGEATSHDVYSLMQLAKTSVKQKFGVDLKEEVFLIGDFAA
jgi:UDP-N-acetylmuramate dehydrogenase